MVFSSFVRLGSGTTRESKLGKAACALRLKDAGLACLIIANSLV